MSTQPKALALADALEDLVVAALLSRDGQTAQTAAELRRLHALNAQMLDAITHCKDWFHAAGYYKLPVQLQCESIIEAAKGQA